MELALVIVGVVLGIFLLSALTGAPYVPTLRKDSRLVFREVLRIGSRRAARSGV